MPTTRPLGDITLYSPVLGAGLTAVGMAVMRLLANMLGASDDMSEYCVVHGRIVVGVHVKLFVGYDAELFDLTVQAFRMYSFAFVFSGIAIYVGRIHRVE